MRAMGLAQYKLCLAAQFLDYSLKGEENPLGLERCGCVRLPTVVVWGSSELLGWEFSLALLVLLGF